MRAEEEKTNTRLSSKLTVAVFWQR